MAFHKDLGQSKHAIQIFIRLMEPIWWNKGNKKTNFKSWWNHWNIARQFNQNIGADATPSINEQDSWLRGPCFGVQDHVLIEENQVLDFADHVLKVNQQHSQKDPLLEEKDHVSEIEIKDLDGRLKHDIICVSKILIEGTCIERKKNN